MVENASWPAELKSAMQRREEIVWLVTQWDEAKRVQVARLCRRHDYAPPASVPPEQWDAFREHLVLTGFAAKEQEITANVVYLLRPA